jgi:hypothetical protein
MIKTAARPFPRLRVFYRCYSTTGTTSIDDRTSRSNNNNNNKPTTSNKNHEFQNPKPHVRWFYATDVPIRKPHLLNWTASSAATKFAPFSPHDSHLLETAYQKAIKQILGGDKPNVSKIHVLEDQLFEVDLLERSLAPVYWDGPVFEVRRGSWFISEGNKPVVPCPEQLAEEIEQLRDNYQQLNDSRGVPAYPKLQNEASRGTNKRDSDKEEQQQQLYKLKTLLNSDDIIKRQLSPKEKGRLDYLLEEKEKNDDNEKEQKFVTFDSKGNTAWVVSNDLASTVLRKLVLIGGTKLVRGYCDTQQEPNKADLETAQDERTKLQAKDAGRGKSELVSNETRPTHRDVDHLVLCVHGIGQRLGQRIESVNFAQDVNVFRKLLKEVYVQNEELQEQARAHTVNNHGSRLGRIRMEEYFTSKEGARDNATNHRVQVIPLIWRHNIQFGMTRDDIEQRATSEEEKAQMASEVSLEDITVEGITPLRNIIGDVVLDVLLFYQPQYHAQIIESNIRLLNSTFRKFCNHNPQFAKNPKVSIVGHSLGSAIVFDILCAQQSEASKTNDQNSNTPRLEFAVDNFFGVGSPVGMFQLLKGNHLVGRTSSANGNNNNTMSPAVNNYYNVFHPSDPVAYRVDPLVHREAASLAPKLVPFAEGSFPSQIQALQQMSLRFASEATNMWNMAASILPSTSKFTDLLKRGEAAAATSPLDKKTTADGKRTETDAEGKRVVEAKKKFEALPSEVQAEIRRRLKALNPTAGQVDHSLQMGPLDITLVAALASHISYFESADFANFVLQSIYAATSENPTEKK